MADRQYGRTDGRFDSRDASSRSHSRRSESHQQSSHSSDRDARRDASRGRYSHDGSRAEQGHERGSAHMITSDSRSRRHAGVQRGSERQGAMRAASRSTQGHDYERTSAGRSHEEASSRSRSRAASRAKSHVSSRATTHPTTHGNTHANTHVNQHANAHASTHASTHANQHTARQSQTPIDRYSRGGRSTEGSRYGSRQGFGRGTLSGVETPKSTGIFSFFTGRTRIFAIAAAIVLVVVVAGCGFAFSYMNGISENLHKGVDDELRSALVQTDMTKEPFYLLLLGTDGSVDRDGDAELAGIYRSDSIMLTRIDPVEKKVALVSLARDIKVDLGEEFGEQKLNAAYGLDGPALTVKTVADLAGVDISHYAQVDFDGFASVVDALGGVEVNVPIDINDPDAGGRVLKAGLQTLDGEQALILCRSRNAYANTASQPDAMRAANQRLVLAAIARKLLDSDIATIANSVKALSNYVTTDLNLTDIIGLAQAMRGLDSETDIYTAAAPTTSQYVNDIWYDFLDEQKWKVMIRRIKEGMPPTEETQVDHSTGTVIASAGTSVSLSREPKYAEITVKNGTSTEGLAGMTRNTLMGYGYKNVVIGDINTEFTYPETLVIYGDDSHAYEANEIVQMIGQGKPFKNNGEYLLYDNDFMIIIGDDWQ